MRMLRFFWAGLILLAACSANSQPPSASVAAAAEGLSLAFEQDTVHLGEDIRFTVAVTNTTNASQDGDLSIRLLGAPILHPYYATAMRYQPVWDHVESLSLAPGESFTAQYTLDFDTYRDVGTGSYAVEVRWQDLWLRDGMGVTGSADVEVSLSPSTVNVGEPTTVTAAISNPTNLMLHDVTLNTERGGPTDLLLGELGPGQTISYSWVWTAPSEDDGTWPVNVEVESAEGGVSIGSADLTLLAPAEFFLSGDIPVDRVAVGGRFTLEVWVQNVGSFPIQDVTVTAAVRAPELFTLGAPLSQTIGELGPNEGVYLYWNGAALRPGLLVVDVTAASGDLSAEHTTGAIIYEPGHGVDLTIDGQGQGLDRAALVTAEAATPAHTNLAEATFQVTVANTGSLPDTFEVYAMPENSDSVAAFVDENGQPTLSHVITLDPGETAMLILSEIGRAHV